jgi:hypothetical protein
MNLVSTEQHPNAPRSLQKKDLDGWSIRTCFYYPLNNMGSFEALTKTHLPPKEHLFVM